jgi:hypothetical protein
MNDKERFLIEHHALAKSHSKRSLFAHLYAIDLIGEPCVARPEWGRVPRPCR